MGRIPRYLAVIVLLLGVVTLALGITFIVQGASVRAMIMERVVAERATSEADGVVGIIDTPEEVKATEVYLRGHRTDIGYYTELDRDDPKRATILKAMTMENSMNLATLSYGVSTVVTVTGVFMIIVGIALVGTGLGLHRLSGRVS